jgi:multicomponent Na+:H+ antiporter subunit F
VSVVEGILLATLVPLLYILVKAPTAWDRLLAYNSAANRVTAVLAISSVVLDRAVLLDVAILYAALSFIGVVALARFMERGGGFR